jgi:hypothetical protein
MIDYLLLGAALASAQVQTAPIPVPPAPIYIQGADAPSTFGAPSWRLGKRLSPSSGSLSYPVSNDAQPAGAGVDGSSGPSGSVGQMLPYPAPDAAPTGNGKKDSNGNGNGDANGDCKVKSWLDYKSGADGCVEFFKPKQETGGFCYRFYKVYYDEFFPDPKAKAQEEPERPRRTNPSPFDSPPFPVNEYQGYPLVGVPYDDTAWPVMKALYGANTPLTDAIKESRVRFYGWVTAGGNWSTASTNNVNGISGYWVQTNRFNLDQLVFRLERNLDSVQQEHIDYGYRITALYGMDYRFMAATGWGSDTELQVHNLLYGWDPTEVYFDVYFPGIANGMIFRVGRWIACPDIETQFAPDNYLATHSILFTFDTYTQTGFMATFLCGKRFMFQIGGNAGNDQAPWAHDAISDPSLFIGTRWVSEDNHDAFYGVLNQLNDARFHHYTLNGQPAGHDNFNYYVATWEHTFNKDLHTKTEGYFMWQHNAELGGSPSIGAAKFGTGGGDNPTLPGTSHAYGLLNYTALAVSRSDYLTFRNEVWEDDRGMRTGFPGLYTSHTIGITHNFNSVFQVRPEIGYYRNYQTPAFDLGTRKGMWLYGFDMTLRF